MSQKKLSDRTPDDIRADRNDFARRAEQDAAAAMKEGRLVAASINGYTVSGAYELISEAAEWWLTGALCEADLDAEEARLRMLPKSPGVTVARSMVAEERSRRYAYRNGVPRP